MRASPVYMQSHVLMFGLLEGVIGQLCIGAAMEDFKNAF